MRRLSGASFDRFIRALVCFALTLSTIGISIPVSVVRANPLNDSPVVPTSPTTPVSPIATPTVGATPTPEATPVIATPTAVPATPAPLATVVPPTIEPPDASDAEPLQVIGKVRGNGGRLTTADERVTLDFPTAAVSDEAEVRYGLRRSRVITDTNQRGAIIEFELQAWKTGKPAPQQVSSFAQPLTLTVNIAGLIDLDNIPAGMYLYLYTLTPEGYQNPVWPIQLNREAGTISAQIDHFSSWGAGLAPGTPGVWEFHYTPPEVSQYSGAATAQIPLQVPAGRSGLQPNLALSYNSAALNGLSGAVLNSLEWTRGGEIGGFWELNGIPKIAREKWEGCWWKYNAADGEHAYEQSCLRDVFSLIIDGTGYDLEPLTPAANQDAIVNIPTRYYAVGGPNLYIERHTVNWRVR